jgi:hypothetical protein
MFATILTLCTYAACNSYYTDHAETQADCTINLTHQSERLADVWDSGKGTYLFLKQYNVREPVELLTDYDYKCEFIPDSDIP